MALPARCLVVFVPVWFAVASAQAEIVDPNDIERLPDAIARIESHCNPNAVGDGAELSAPPDSPRLLGRRDGIPGCGLQRHLGLLKCALPKWVELPLFDQQQIK